MIKLQDQPTRIRAGTRIAPGPTRRGQVPDRPERRAAGPGRIVPRPDYLPGQIILRVREAAVRASFSVARPSLRSAEASDVPREVSDALDALRRNAGLKDVRPIFARRRTELAGLSAAPGVRHRMAVRFSVADTEEADLAGIVMARLDERKLSPSLLRQLGDSKVFEYVERMPARWLAEQPAATSRAADPKQNLQWGLRAIRWFDAPHADASQVKVGVLDTGVDQGHPDLKGVVAEYHHEGLKAEDVIGHGTHVSGIIAALTNNGVGISGIAGCRLAVWKIFDDEPSSDGEFYVDGERYFRALNALHASGVTIVNLSIGGSGTSRTEELLFQRLIRRGLLVVAAMGNEYQQGNPKEYPAAHKDVLAVGAVNEASRRAAFSNTGSHIALVAPGTNILSTLPWRKSPYRDESRYAAWSGTSMATPHATGAAALLAAVRPELDRGGLTRRLRDTASRVSAMGEREFTSEYGSGLLNLQKALS